MDKKDKSIFRGQVLSGYKLFMQPLYLEWNKYSSNELRLIALEILTGHIVEKSRDVLKKRRYRKNKKVLEQRKLNDFLPELLDF